MTKITSESPFSESKSKVMLYKTTKTPYRVPTLCVNLTFISDYLICDISVENHDTL